MPGFTCHFCNQIMSIMPSTHITRCTSFERIDDLSGATQGYDDQTIQLDFYRCPSCYETTIYLTGRGQDVKDLSLLLHPRSIAKSYPNYIPKKILEDYQESCLILHLSPKASATLARRCLQGMIHDFWDIKLKNLNQEITSLKDKIPNDLWIAINSLRELGNIGAHMEKDINTIVDIDSGEAERLLKLIELLMKEWYINREERNKLLSEITSINAEKQEQRKSKE